MALDQKETRTFRSLKQRLVNLERASHARERTLEQLAERLGVELDLTRVSTASEEYEAEMSRKASKHLLESEEVKAYLRESESDDTR
jgi:soluble P-type ATPase